MMRSNILKFTKDDYILWLVFKIVLCIKLVASVLAIFSQAAWLMFFAIPAVAMQIWLDTMPLILIFISYLLFIPPKEMFAKSGKPPPAILVVVCVFVLHYLIITTSQVIDQASKNEISFTSVIVYGLISIYLYILLYALCKKKIWSKYMSIPIILSPFLIVFYSLVISGVSLGKISFQHVSFLILILFSFWLTYYLLTNKSIDNYFNKT